MPPGVPAERGRRALTALRAGAAAPLAAVRRTARDPVLVRVQLSYAAVMVAFWLATVSLSVVAFAEGGSGAVAVALLVRTVAGALAGPLVGAVVDRLPRHRCLMWGAALSAAASGTAAGTAGSLVATVVLITVVALLCTSFRAGQSAILPDLVDEPSELTAVNVLSSSIESVGVFVGPALAGLLLVVQGPELAFAAAAVLFTLAATLLLGSGPRSSARTDAASVSRGRAAELLRIPAARLLLLLLVAQTVVSGGLVVLYPALAVDAFEADLSAVGLLASAFGLGGVLGSLALFALAGSRRLGLFTFLSLLLWALPLLLMPAAPAIGYALLLLVVVGSGNVLFDVTSVTLLQRGVPSRLLGRAFGAVETAAVLGLGAGAVAASALDSFVGAGAAIGVLASPLAVVALISLSPLRRLDRVLAAPTQQVQRLRSLAPFALLPPLEIEGLALHLRRVELGPGEVAVRQGDRGTTWFVVDEGRLVVDVDGKPIGEMSAGDAFGEVALLHGGIRTATVTASQPSVLWALDGGVFLATLRSHDGRALDVLHAVAQERMAHAAHRRR